MRCYDNVLVNAVCEFTHCTTPLSLALSFSLSVQQAVNNNSTPRSARRQPLRCDRVEVAPVGNDEQTGVESLSAKVEDSESMVSCR